MNIDFTDLTSTNEYLAKRVSPIVQRLLHDNRAEAKNNELGQDTKTTVFNLRRLCAEKKVPIERIQIGIKKPLDFAEAKLRAGLAEPDSAAIIADQAAEIASLRSEIATLRSEAELLRKPTEIPEAASVPPLGSLNGSIEKAAIKLAQLLMVMTDASADDVLTRVGDGKTCIKAWYGYRRGGQDLGDLTSDQRHAAQLMDVIYLSFKNFDDGRKQVQDILNKKWWKIVYPGGKITLNGVDDPTVMKISFNSAPPS